MNRAILILLTVFAVLFATVAEGSPVLGDRKHTPGRFEVDSQGIPTPLLEDYDYYPNPTAPEYYYYNSD